MHFAGVHCDRNQEDPNKKWLNGIREDCSDLGITLYEVRARSGNKEVVPGIPSHFHPCMKLNHLMKTEVTGDARSQGGLPG